MPSPDIKDARFVLTAALVDEFEGDPETIVAELMDAAIIEWLSVVLTVLMARRFGTGIPMRVLTDYAHDIRALSDQQPTKPILVEAVLRAGTGDTRLLGGLEPGEFLEPAGIVIRHLYGDLVQTEGLTLALLFAEASKLHRRELSG